MKIYIPIVIIGIIMVIVILSYIISLPNGIEYSNGFFSKIESGKLYNIPYHSIEIISIGISNNPTVKIFNNSANIANLVSNGSYQSIILFYPENKTYYNLNFENNNYKVLISNNLLTFSISNGKLNIPIYNSTFNGAVIENINFTSPLESILTGKNSNITITYNYTIQTIPIKVLIVPNNASYYDNISVSCISNNSGTMKMFSNYNHTIVSGSSSVSEKLFGYPYTEIYCYNGYNILKYNITLKPLNPILTIAYNQTSNSFSCDSNFMSVINYYINKTKVFQSFGNKYYKINRSAPYNLTCVQLANKNWSLEKSKTLIIK